MQGVFFLARACRTATFLVGPYAISGEDGGSRVFLSATLLTWGDLERMAWRKVAAILNLQEADNADPARFIRELAERRKDDRGDATALFEFGTRPGR